MSFSLPNPTVPTNGQTGDATPILQNEIAIAQAIASFDGSQLQNGTVVEAALANAINPRLRGSEIMSNFVYTGCTWSLVSGFSGTMTGGTIYVNGYRTVVSGVGANTFAASSDTYVYIDYLGNVTYSAVANSAASPSATANAILVAIVITNGSTITSVNQGSIAAVAPVVSSNTLTVSDSLGNLIYPTDPSSKILAYRQITTDFTTTSATATQITGLSCPVIIPTGRKIKVTLFGYKLGNTSGTNTAEASIWDGTVPSGTRIVVGDTLSVGAAATAAPANIQAVLTPGTTTKTYNAGALATAGTTTLGAAATTPAFLMVELY